MSRVDCPNCAEELSDIVVPVPINGRILWNYCTVCKKLVDPVTGVVGPEIDQRTLEQLQKP